MQDNVGPERVLAEQRQPEVIEPEQPVDGDVLCLLQRRDGRLQGWAKSLFPGCENFSDMLMQK